MSLCYNAEHEEELTARLAAFVNAFAASANIADGVRLGVRPLGAMVWT